MSRVRKYVDLSINRLVEGSLKICNFRILKDFRLIFVQKPKTTCVFTWCVTCAVRDMCMHFVLMPRFRRITMQLCDDYSAVH